MTETSDRTISIGDRDSQQDALELLGDAVLDVLEDADGYPRKVVPTALILHGDVVAWITPPEDAQVTDDAEPVPAHLHSWTVLGAQEVAGGFVAFGKPMPRTAVLSRCAHCGEPVAWLLDGTWTLEDFATAGDDTASTTDA